MEFTYTFLKMITAFFLLLLIVTVSWFCFKWYSDPAYVIGKVKGGRILKYDDSSPEQGDKEERNGFRVISYNMGFAAGPMQHTLADDHPKSFFESNLDGLIQLVRDEDADIVLLQEVDIDSKRSWYVNQLDYIMERLGWGYAAPVVDWDMYFPLRKERKITKATVVISKFPIVSNEYVLTSCKPNFENSLLNIFYYPLLWKSAMQKVAVEVRGHRLDVYNVHLCVWNRDARVAQAAFLVDWINRDSQGGYFIIGGDFNFQAYIRGTPVPENDMQKPPFLNELWAGVGGLGEILSSPGDSSATIHKEFTFPERNHRYDFIFYADKLTPMKGRIVTGLDVSDHYPVSADFKFME